MLPSQHKEHLSVAEHPSVEQPDSTGQGLLDVSSCEKLLDAAQLTADIEDDTGSASSMELSRPLENLASTSTDHEGNLSPALVPKVVHE